MTCASASYPDAAPGGPEPAPDGRCRAGPRRQTAAQRGLPRHVRSLPQWKRVLSKAKTQIQALNSCSANCPAGAASWRKIIHDAQEQDPMTQLKMVNAFFNKWPYGLDIDIYGTSDWWATPHTNS